MNQMKKNIIVVLIIVALIGLLVISKKLSNEKKIDKENVNIEIVIKDYGTIRAELYPNIAPITVENFVSLVESKYYDGLRLHRIIEGFMMQGGNGAMMPTIKGEFNLNGVTNNLLHTRGVLSMARPDDLNGASTQFFIVQEVASHLDTKYASFGMVTEGMEVVDEICNNVPVTDNNGTVLLENQPVIESIRIIK